jgi:hypothetical protein
MISWEKRALSGHLHHLSFQRDTLVVPTGGSSNFFKQDLLSIGGFDSSFNAEPGL